MTNETKPELEWHTVHLDIEDELVHWASEKPARGDELFIENGHYEIRQYTDAEVFTEPPLLKARPRGPRGGHQGFEVLEFATVAEAQAAIEAWCHDEERKANAVADREKHIADRSTRMLKADARRLRDDMLEEIESMENAEDDGALDEVEYYKSRFAHVRRELQNAIMVYEARCASEGLPSTDVLHEDQRRVQVDGATAEQIGAWEVLQADRERRLHESQINALELDLERRPSAQPTTATDTSRWTVVVESRRSAPALA